MLISRVKFEKLAGFVYSVKFECFAGIMVLQFCQPGDKALNF